MGKYLNTLGPLVATMHDVLVVLLEMHLGETSNYIPQGTLFNSEYL